MADDRAHAIGADHEIGFDLGAVGEGERGAIASLVDADEAMARSLGVTGVPFFVFDRKYAVSGAQPPEVLAQALERTWAEETAATGADLP